tara:strand:+ start:37 stop:285 length:249 start_codon:yes stop_codon:yes gene_type:complete
MPELERLQKRVVDTEAAFDAVIAAAYAAANAADAVWDAADAWDAAAYAAADAAYAIDKAAAYAAWSKAKRELEDYLKEQDYE